MRLTNTNAAMGTAVVLAASYAASAAAVRVRRRARSGPLVAFAGGGTGTHVFSAIAMASELRNRGVQVVLLGEAGGLEGVLARRYGLPLCGTSSVELKRPLRRVENVINALRFVFCVAQGVRALVECAPDVVVGTGGSASVPACVAAAALGIPFLLYEPNARLGAITQHLHPLARRTLLAYDSAAAGLRHRDRCTVVGPAVRREVLGAGAGGGGGGGSADDEAALAREQRRRRARVRSTLRLPRRGSRLLLVLGGCRGSTYLNCALHNALPQLAAVPGLHILWQTGDKYHEAYACGYASTLPNVHCVPFLPDVGAALAASDLVVGRAGACSVAELRAAGAPALLVPSPAACEATQAANAATLAERGMAVVVPQPEVDELGIAPRLLAVLAAAGSSGHAPPPSPSPAPPPAAGQRPARGVAAPEAGSPWQGGAGGASQGEAAAAAVPAAMVAAMKAGERRGVDAGCLASLALLTDTVMEYAAGRHR